MVNLNAWENTEKYTTFSVPIRKEFENGKTITCKLKFIDSFRFMSDILSKLGDNLSKIYKNRMQRMHGKKKNHVRMRFYWASN